MYEIMHARFLRYKMLEFEWEVPITPPLIPINVTLYLLSLDIFKISVLAYHFSS